MKKLLIFAFLLISVSAQSQLWRAYYDLLETSDLTQPTRIDFIVENNTADAKVLTLATLQEALADSSYLKIRVVPSSSLASPVKGDIYYDSDTDELLLYNGTSFEVLNYAATGYINWAAGTGYRPLVVSVSSSSVDSAASITYDDATKSLHIAATSELPSIALSTNGGASTQVIYAQTDDLHISSPDDIVLETTGDIRWGSAAVSSTEFGVLDGADVDLKTLSLPASTTISTFGATLVSQTSAANARSTLQAAGFPSAGIALSTGSAWDTPVANNSSNWNTAYGWGNHAVAGYLTGSDTVSIDARLGILEVASSGYLTGNDTMSIDARLDALEAGGGGGTGTFDTTYLHYRIDSIASVLSDTEEFETVSYPSIITFGMGSGQTIDTSLFATNSLVGWFCNTYGDTIVLDSCLAVVVGTSPDVSFDIAWGANFDDGSPTLATASPINVTSTTTGSWTTSFTNSIVLPGDWVVFKITAVAVKPEGLAGQVNYHLQ